MVQCLREFDERDAKKVCDELRATLLSKKYDEKILLKIRSRLCVNYDLKEGKKF